MGVERFNTEQPTNDWQAQSETAASFEPPKDGDSGKSGKKESRKRKRNRQNRQSGEPSESTTKPENSQDKRPERVSILGGGVIWERDKNDKTVPANEETTEEVIAEVPVISPEHVHVQQAELNRPSEVVLEPTPEATPETTPEPVPAAYPVYNLQPQIQHQGADLPPPLPPDPAEFLQYRRRFWDESTDQTEQAANREALPPLFDYAQQEQQEQFATEALSAAPYTSDIPPGLQRTPTEVSRAAWTGVVAGWFLGSRGKRRAVKQAHEAGVQAGQEAATQNWLPTPEQYRPPQLEAEPMHSYQTSEGSRATVQPLSVETHRPIPAVYQTAETAPAYAPERVDLNMGKRELMKIAKDVKIDGISLKEVFKARRIDEEGVRAVVSVYLRGGDIRQQLAKEIITKEQSYERDPRLRHQRRSGEYENRGSHGESRTGERVSMAVDHAKDIAREQGSKLASSTQKTAHSASRALASGAKVVQRDVIDNTNTADWLSITAVVIIYSIILILLLG